MSGMFDEWSYAQVYETVREPETVPETDPKSLVKEVASLTIEPPPRARPRSNTTDTPGETFETVSPLTVDTPLLEREKRKWSKKAWLGQADPGIFDFDEEEWRSQISIFEDVKQLADIAVCIAKQTQLTAKTLSNEVEWLLKEVEDTTTHDLVPLQDILEKKTALQTRKETANDIRRALELKSTSQDQIRRILRGPAPKAVPQLPKIIADIDRGIEFCEQHPDFLDIEASLASWRECGVRALAIAGAYVTHELRKITHRISGKLGSSAKGAAHALLYAKYRNDALSLKPIIELIRERGNAGNTWLDLQRTYCELRNPLISPEAGKYAEDLQDFVDLNDEFIDKCRTAIVQTRQLCLSEQKLFSGLFGTPTRTFNTWLGDVALPLYAAVRKLLVRESDINKLCKIVVLVSDNSKDEHTVDFNDHNSLLGSVGESIVGSLKGNDTSPAAAIVADTDHSEAAEELTGDPVRDLLAPAVQSRLVFRVNREIDEMQKYEPVPKDFLRAKFPTVDITITLLSQVYELLKPNVFNDIAYRCVHECLASLDHAVANKMANSNAYDITIHLFHIKQLLILQSQISDFDLHNSVVHEVDFSGIQQLLSFAYGNRKINTFRELITLAWDSVPRVVDILVDSMEELFASLRRAVERMCSAFVQSVFDTKHNFVEDMTELRTNASEQFSKLKKSIMEHTNDSEFTHFLLDSAQEAIMDRYTIEYRKLSDEDQRNEDVMDIDTMAAWLSGAITHDYQL